MRVLVTGSSGFIGRHVVAELTARGHTPLPFDKPDDITSRLAVISAVRKADAVINLAGALGTSELLGAEAHAVAVNICGAVQVLDAAARARIPVVQIGTGHKGQPNPYAITKACAEDLALARARWNGEKIAVVRAYHVYGEGQKPPPPWGHSPVRKIFPAFACQALAGVPLEIYGDGTQQVDMVHVSDVARVLVDAVAGPYGEVLEAGTGQPLTVRRVASDIARAAGWFGAPRYVPMRRGEPDHAEVFASRPLCGNLWPYMVGETLASYKQYVR